MDTLLEFSMFLVFIAPTALMMAISLVDGPGDWDNVVGYWVP
jgi:hypothetical protein